MFESPLIIAAALITSVAYVAVLYRFLYHKRLSIATDVLPKLLPIVAGSLGAVAASFSLFVDRSSSLDSSELRAEVVAAARNQELLASLRQSEERYQKLLTQASSLTPASAPRELTVAIDALRAENEGLKQRIEKFEQLFMTDAERLVTLPLLRGELSSLKQDIEGQKAQIANISTLLTDTNEQNRWVIGTLALGMLALIIPAIKSMFGKKNDE